MSIQPTWHAIRALEASGRLAALQPKSPRDAVVRPLFAVPSFVAALDRTCARDWEQKRYSELRADLEVFLTGQPVVSSYMKLLTPQRDAVWEIRSKKPRPSIRVFGAFIERDIFIVTNYQTRHYLGFFNSMHWKEAIRLSRFEFYSLFGRYGEAGELSDLVTGAINV